MKKFNTCNSSTQRLNSDTDFINWDAKQIKSTIAALKSKAEAFNCKLRISSSEITLTNRQGAFFSAVFDDDYGIEKVEFNMSGSAIRGSLAELDEITEKAAGKLDALNELKQAWRDVSQWLELLAYAKKNNINASRRKLNSSVDVDYDYAGEELEDGYFEGSVAGTCTGLSQKYAKAPNWQFNNDVAAYVSTAADIISATQHNDHFEVEISAQDEDEFEDTVAEVIEFIRTEAAR